jgi:hypothetical protein
MCVRPPQLALKTNTHKTTVGTLVKAILIKELSMIEPAISVTA